MAEKMLQSKDDSLEVAGELDDALNELGMLSSASDKSKRDFIKDKWSVAGRRGYPLRYPLRREKEKEINWCSGSSSSSGSSSRRSSSSSSGSFSSCSYSRSYSRSSLISSYSIAETPTGNAPGPFGSTSSSSSSLCSSLDLDQPMTGMSSKCNFKSVDFPKVLRRVHHQSYKPYNLGKPSRRFSLQLGIHREERIPGAYTSGVHDTLNLRSGLSDSEASSGSGTGTPPPPNMMPSFHGCTLKLDPLTLRLKSPLSFKETKSNPGSPGSELQVEYTTSQCLGQEQQQSQQPGGESVSSLGFVDNCCQFVHHVHNPAMSRSKSLDDLTFALFDNNSSCSSDFANNQLAPNYNQLNQASSQQLTHTQQTNSNIDHIHAQQKLLNLNLNPLQSTSTGNISSHGVSSSSSDLPVDQQSTTNQFSATSTTTSTCDTSAFENVLQRIGRLEM